MSLAEGIPPLSDSIWPYDTWQPPDAGPSGQFDKLRCFVLCPFARAEFTLFMVRRAAMTLEGLLNHQIEVYYAGDMAGPGTIHPDIWAQIRRADMIVADITGYNPNVMYELGVAAARRPIGGVIIVRDKRDERQPAFDLLPARQRIYDSSLRGWIEQLHSWLAEDMWHSLALVPFHDVPAYAASFPFEFSFDKGHDTPALWSPLPGHRRLIEGGLEFGSPFNFPYSWITPVGLSVANVRVLAELAFTDRLEPCWMGVAVRSQGYMSDYEHLTWVGSDGIVHRTGPGMQSMSKDEHEVGRLCAFDPAKREFVLFDISMDATSWSIRVGDVHEEVPLENLPHVFPSGRILLQTARCRSALKEIRIGEPQHESVHGGDR